MVYISTPEEKSVSPELPCSLLLGIRPWLLRLYSVAKAICLHDSRLDGAGSGKSWSLSIRFGQ